MDDLRLRSTAEVSAMTGVSEGTLRYWRHRGDYGPPSGRIGKRIVYKEQEVIDWINEQFQIDAQRRATA